MEDGCASFGAMVARIERNLIIWNRENNRFQSLTSSMHSVSV